MYNLPYTVQKFYYRYIKNHQDYFNANSFLKSNFCLMEIVLSKCMGIILTRFPKKIILRKMPQMIFLHHTTIEFLIIFQAKTVLDRTIHFTIESLSQFCLNVPMEYKLKNGISRYYFKEAIKDYVPKSIHSRNSKADISGLFLNELLIISKRFIKQYLFK